MVENAIFTLKTQIMATLTLVIVPAKRLSDGTHKIRIRVAHNSETRFITTDIVVRENEFKNGKNSTPSRQGFSQYKITTAIQPLFQAIHGTGLP